MPRARSWSSTIFARARTGFWARPVIAARIRRIGGCSARLCRHAFTHGRPADPRRSAAAGLAVMPGHVVDDVPGAGCVRRAGCARRVDYVRAIASATTVGRGRRPSDRSTIAGRAPHVRARRRHRLDRPLVHGCGSPPDVVPQNVRRAARAPGAGAHPERRHAHARSGGTVAAARTPDGPIAPSDAGWRHLAGSVGG